MLVPSISLLVLICRALVVYGVVLVLLRISGKKQFGEMAPADLVVLLFLSESVQNALVSDDKSVTGGLVVACTLLAASQLVGFIAWRWRKAGRLIEGAPCVLARNGQVYRERLEREQITQSELMEALRKNGCSSLGSIRFAVLENDGTITVGLRRQSAEPVEARGQGTTGAG